MLCTRVTILAVLLTMLACPLLAQEAETDFDELWRVGSLWQVGDNRERVDDARQAIIDAGDDGLKYALTKLDVADTLQIRCLRAVFAGFGDTAYDDLVANISHDEPAARRNVAELLTRLDDSRAADPLLAQAKVEESLGAKLAQLAALSKWELEAGVPLMVEISNSEADRIRHRATSLLGPFSTMEAVERLIEMLDDDVYYVREGARDALAKGSKEARFMCFESLQGELELPAVEQKLRRVRLLLPVVATLAVDAVPQTLEKALGHESGAVRAEAGDALVTWKQGAGLLDDSVDVQQMLRDALKDEYDPFAKSALESALARLTDSDEK
jgi:hypothetical protein